MDDRTARIEPADALPAASEASVRRGMWLVFPVGQHMVRAWGSCLTGKERVYVDGDIVSEHRSLGIKGVHAFAVDGIEHQIVFNLAGVASLECTALADGQVARHFVVTYLLPSPASPLRFLAALALGCCVGYCAECCQLPQWAPALLAVTVISGVLLTGIKKGSWSIAESAPPSLGDGPAAPEPP